MFKMLHKRTEYINTKNIVCKKKLLKLNKKYSFLTIANFSNLYLLHNFNFIEIYYESDSYKKSPF